MDGETAAGTDRKEQVCPKCGFTQDEAFECLRCGVIFQKYRARGSAVSLEAAHPGNAARPRTTKVASLLQGKVILCCVLMAIAMFLLLRWYAQRPIVHGPGMIASKIPQQVNLRQAAPFRHKEYVITPLATFDIEARVLSSTRYRFDPGAELAPYDLALGWGPMSDESVLNALTITQSNRFYYWWTERFPIPRRTIEVNSANMHLIPANDAMATRLGRVRTGHIVTIKGFLVRADRNNWHWISSLTRQDTGAGGCELIWVQEMTVR